ncbi:hypothetical protein O0L34_g11400 [Tuta absoluta]|nr:hypothetical protein O0L34_g11400 [Tuta absoluta]
MWKLLKMGAHGSKEKLYRANSEKYPSKLPVPSDKKYIAVKRERFGSFGARGNGKKRESAPTPTAPARPAPPPQTPPSFTQAKKNGVVQKLSSSPVSVRARTSLAPPPSPRKPPQHRVPPAQRPNTLSTNNKGKFENSHLLKTYKCI